MRTITVPLILVNLQDNGFHLLVEIVVFGQKLFAVLDTGASRSVFDKALLEANVQDLQENDEQQAATIFSSATTLVGTIPLLKIGKLKLPNYETVAIDLQSVSDTYLQMGQPAIAGIIGGDILVEYNCKIDYKKMVLRFYKD
ncbi:MAG: aspartyl protease family protein [Pedobacter sp.]|uniref:aspartyl protease family protein n=1 Tax=Pedobacter sp. TaxID=1411316 RepID=UPI0028070D30|nr:aspartyl protease family protein [Pedobacter sp.]MDQ8005233.1 aspartyl protease family protein [Pedobacter sp.]